MLKIRMGERPLLKERNKLIGRGGLADDLMPVLHGHLAGDQCGAQDFLSFWGAPRGQWMDARENRAGIKGFVAEFSPAAAPLLAPVLLPAIGILGLAAIRRKQQ